AEGPSVALEGGSRCFVRGHCNDGTSHQVGDRVMVGVRAEDIEIIPATSDSLPDQAVAAKAVSALFLGDKMQYHVEVQGNSIIVRGDRHRAVEAGSPVWLRIWPTGHTVWAVGA